MSESTSSRRPDDWTTAALEAMRDGGVGAVRVEAIARRIGTTKGSFYWHFGNREELVTAALRQWEEQETDAVIEGLDFLATPQERLRRLLTRAFTRPQKPDLGVVLARDAAHDGAVAETLRRVVARRIEYIAGLLRVAGLPSSTARDRAVLVYTSYVGLASLNSTPDSGLLDVRDADRFAREIVTLMEIGA